MSMAPTTEQHSASRDLGQRLFMLGIFAILVAEVVTTLVNVGHWFEWSSCLLGIVAAVGILYLGNWLYTGDKTALLVMRVWVLLQLVLVIIALLLVMAGDSTDSTLPRHLGINSYWQGFLKLAVYLSAAGLLVLPGVTLDFFTLKRGEMPEAAPKPATTNSVPTGNSVELTAEHTKVLESLRGAMKAASALLLLAGTFELLTGLSTVGSTAKDGVLSIVEGAAVAALGVVLLAPAAAIQMLLGASPRNMGYVMDLITRLCATWKAYVMVLLVLAVVVVCRLLLNPGA